MWLLVIIEPAIDLLRFEPVLPEVNVFCVQKTAYSIEFSCKVLLELDWMALIIGLCSSSSMTFSIISWSETSFSVFLGTIEVSAFWSNSVVYISFFSSKVWWFIKYACWAGITLLFFVVSYRRSRLPTERLLGKDLNLTMIFLVSVSSIVDCYWSILKLRDSCVWWSCVRAVSYRKNTCGPYSICSLCLDDSATRRKASAFSISLLIFWTLT